MESYIPISFLNDFIFCPRSIYFHQVYTSFDVALYHEDIQTKGRLAHKNIDNKRYSTRKDILQGLDIYSTQYGLCGRIDVFDKTKKMLMERKKKVTKIYDGFVFQIYAHYYCLKEMGYNVEKLCIHSLDDNKNYFILLPKDNPVMDQGFKNVLKQIRAFDMTQPFFPNISKCKKCIYKNLCDYGPVSC